MLASFNLPMVTSPTLGTSLSSQSLKGLDWKTSNFLVVVRVLIFRYQICGCAVQGVEKETEELSSKVIFLWRL